MPSILGGLNGGGGGAEPQTGAGNPNGVLTARFVGDLYIDTDTGEIYAALAETDADWRLI